MHQRKVHLVTSFQNQHVVLSKLYLFSSRDETIQQGWSGDISRRYFNLVIFFYIGHPLNTDRKHEHSVPPVMREYHVAFLSPSPWPARERRWTTTKFRARLRIRRVTVRASGATGRLGGELLNNAASKKSSRVKRTERKWKIASAASAAHALHAAVVYLGPSTLMSPMRAELALTIPEIALPLNVFRVINCALLIPSGMLLDRVGAARLIWPAMVVTAIFAALMPFAQTLAHLTILQAVFGSAFLFCGMTSMLMLVNDAFGRDSGTGAGAGAGIVLAGWSLAGCIAPSIVGIVGARYGWRVATGALNAVFVIVALPLTHRYLRRRPPSCVLPPEDALVDEPLFSKRYVATLLMMGAMSISYHIILDHLPIFMREDLGMPFQRCSIVLSTMNLCGFLAKLGGGWVSDRFPSGAVFAAFSALTGISCLFLVRLTSAGTFVLASAQASVLAFVVFFGLTYSVVFTLITTALREFGLQRLGLRSNLNLMALFGFGSIGSSIAGALRVAQGSYLHSFLLSAAMWVLILACSVMFILGGRHNPVVSKGR